MSATEDKDQAMAETGASDHDAHGGAVGPIILFFILGLAASWVLGWLIFPKLLYSQHSQPFNFNHKLHVEETGDCESCHYFRDDGSFNGIPDLESCMECHEEQMGDTEDELVFLEEYVYKEREIPWKVYARQPPCVFFSHAAHVKAGQMDCVTCHGHIGHSETSRVYEENRISGYSRDIWGRNMLPITENTWDRMKMNDCEHCHARNKVGVRRDVLDNPVSSHFLESVNMIWPMSTGEYKGTSVQTERGGCLVCHH